MSEVQAKEMAGLMERLAKCEEEKDAIQATLTEKNKEISSIESAIRNHLLELGWDEFKCPLGEVKLREEFQVRMPPEDRKQELWEWMKEKGIFERYATVHAVSLKALFKAEREIAVHSGADPITFSLPGMEPATVFQVVKFRPVKK